MRTIDFIFSIFYFKYLFYIQNSQSYTLILIYFFLNYKSYYIKTLKNYSPSIEIDQRIILLKN